VEDKAVSKGNTGMESVYATSERLWFNATSACYKTTRDRVVSVAIPNMNRCSCMTGEGMPAFTAPVIFWRRYTLRELIFHDAF
jgi:hypothetical protein